MSVLNGSYAGASAQHARKADAPCRERRLERLSLVALALALILACAFSHAATAEAASGLTSVATNNLIAEEEAASDDAPQTQQAPQANSSLTTAPTPRKKADAGIRWAVTVDSGYASPPTLIGDEIVVTSGSGGKGVISKLDKNTGKTKATAKMKGASIYALIPPTYADGMIFVTLAGGAMEAFDANTLKSLWHYENALGGQGNCPVVYSDGLVYTGYWSGETSARSFVCLDAKTGKLVWEKKNTGGYYWAGALAVGDYLLFGCDDGKSSPAVGSSKVRCVNKKTGQEISSVTVKGDQRSGIVYDSDLGRVYFTTKAGLLYSAQFDTRTGKLTNLKSLKIDLESSATPLVYGGRVYVGGSSGGFSKGTLSVVDASTLKMLYTLDGKTGVDGTVKSMPLVSIAYANGKTTAGEADSGTPSASTTASAGKLFLYFTVNNPPGGIKVLAVEPGSTKASQAKVKQLFTPPNALQQYCISDVICDEEGNLYYRNDSNYLMSVGPGGTDPKRYQIPKEESSKGGSGHSMGSKPGSNTSNGNKANKPDNGSSDNNSSSNSTTNADTSSSQNTQETGSPSSDSAPQRRYLQMQTGGSPMSSNASAVDSNSTGSAANTRSGSSGSSSDTNATSKSVTDKSAGTSGGTAGGATASNTTGSANESTRHTDAEAATTRLDEAANPGAPAWLAPVIVAGVAAAALLVLFLVRMNAGKRRSHAGEEPDEASASSTDAPEADASGGPHEG